MRMWKPACQKCHLRLSLIICPLLVCSWVTECWGRGSWAHLSLGAQQVVRAVLEHCCSAIRQDVSHLHISQTSSTPLCPHPTPPQWRITSFTVGEKPHCPAFEYPSSLASVPTFSDGADPSGEACAPPGAGQRSSHPSSCPGALCSFPCSIAITAFSAELFLWALNLLCCYRLSLKNPLNHLTFPARLRALLLLWSVFNSCSQVLSPYSHHLSFTHQPTPIGLSTLFPPKLSVKVTSDFCFAKFKVHAS